MKPRSRSRAGNLLLLLSLGLAAGTGAVTEDDWEWCPDPPAQTPEETVVGGVTVSASGPNHSWMPGPPVVAEPPACRAGLVLDNAGVCVCRPGHEQTPEGCRPLCGVDQLRDGARCVAVAGGVGGVVPSAFPSPPLSQASQLGAQGQQPGPADEKWYALCQKQGLQVVYGKSTDPTRYQVMQGPFPGPRNAEFWIRQNCPSWKCTAAGACAAAGEVRGGGNWAAVCSRSHGGAAVTQHPNVTQHWIWQERLFGEPDARAWMDQNCPSWRCDRDGRCLAGSRPQETTASGQPVELPPDASDVVRQFDARRQARDQGSWGSGYGAGAWDRPGRFSAEGMRQEMDTRSAEAGAGAAASGSRDRSRTGTTSGTTTTTPGTTTGTRAGTTGGGTLRMNEACRSSAECAAGLFCDRGLCRPQTASTPATTSTTTSTGTPGLGNRCASDRECPSPLKCINKVCLHAEHPRAGTSGAATAQATTPSGPYVPKGTGTACPSVGSQVAARCQQMVADCKARNCAGGGYSGCAVDCPGCSGGYDHITGWCALHPSYAGMASGGLSSFVGEIQACVTRFLADNQPGRRERGMECQGQAQKRLDDNWKRWIEQACQARCSQDGRRGAVKVMPHRCECQ